MSWDQLIPTERSSCRWREAPRELGSRSHSAGLERSVTNALTYGDGSAPAILEVQGAEREIFVLVKNQGAAIPVEALPTLFDPLSRGGMPDVAGGNTHLGLGLFIAREIVKAHRGEIHVRSEGGETVFSVRLPRAMQ